MPPELPRGASGGEHRAPALLSHRERAEGAISGIAAHASSGVLFGANLLDAKQHNRRVVMEAIRLHERISRADIKRLTRLSTQTVSNIADEFVVRALLAETQSPRSARGKPPKLLSINADGAFSVGLQLDHRELSGILLDFGGCERARVRFSLPEPTPDEGVPALRAAIDDLIAGAGVDRDRVCGVGVVMPGPFDVNERTGSGPTVLPLWQSFPLVESLSKAAKLPVFLENDALGAAMGELYFGAARGMRDLVCLHFATGLGGGLVIDGRPYRGKNGNAGEIGHVPIFADGRPCYCGGTGCAEQYLSLHAAYEASGYDGTNSSPTALSDALAKRTEAMMRWIDVAARTLELTIVGLENMLDPETIVLTGYMPEDVLAAVTERIEPLPPSVSLHRGRTLSRLTVGELGERSAVLGAGVFPFFHSFGAAAPVHGMPAAPSVPGG